MLLKFGFVGLVLLLAATQCLKTGIPKKSPKGKFTTKVPTRKDASSQLPTIFHHPFLKGYQYSHLPGTWASNGVLQKPVLSPLQLVVALQEQIKNGGGGNEELTNLLHQLMKNGDGGNEELTKVLHELMKNGGGGNEELLHELISRQQRLGQMRYTLGTNGMFGFASGYQPDVLKTGFQTGFNAPGGGQWMRQGSGQQQIVQTNQQGMQKNPESEQLRQNIVVSGASSPENSNQQGMPENQPGMMQTNVVSGSGGSALGLDTKQLGFINTGINEVGNQTNIISPEHGMMNNTPGFHQGPPGTPQRQQWLGFNLSGGQWNQNFITSPEGRQETIINNIPGFHQGPPGTPQHQQGLSFNPSGGQWTQNFITSPEGRQETIINNRPGYHQGPPGTLQPQQGLGFNPSGGQWSQNFITSPEGGQQTIINNRTGYHQNPQGMSQDQQGLNYGFNAFRELGSQSSFNAPESSYQQGMFATQTNKPESGQQTIINGYHQNPQGMSHDQQGLSNGFNAARDQGSQSFFNAPENSYLHGMFGTQPNKGFSTSRDQGSQSFFNAPGNSYQQGMFATQTNNGISTSRDQGSQSFFNAPENSYQQGMFGTQPNNGFSTSRDQGSQSFFNAPGNSYLHGMFGTRPNNGISTSRERGSQSFFNAPQNSDQQGMFGTQLAGFEPDAQGMLAQHNGDLMKGQNLLRTYGYQSGGTQSLPNCVQKPFKYQKTRSSAVGKIGKKKGSSQVPMCPCKDRRPKQDGKNIIRKFKQKKHRDKFQSDGGILNFDPNFGGAKVKKVTKGFKKKNSYFNPNGGRLKLRPSDLIGKKRGKSTKGQSKKTGRLGTILKTKWGKRLKKKWAKKVMKKWDRKYKKKSHQKILGGEEAADTTEWKSNNITGIDKEEKKEKEKKEKGKKKKKKKKKKKEKKDKKKESKEEISEEEVSKDSQLNENGRRTRRGVTNWRRKESSEEKTSSKASSEETGENSTKEKTKDTKKEDEVLKKLSKNGKQKISAKEKKKIKTFMRKWTAETKKNSKGLGELSDLKPGDRVAIKIHGKKERVLFASKKFRKLFDKMMAKKKKESKMASKSSSASENEGIKISKLAGMSGKTQNSSSSSKMSKASSKGKRKKSSSTGADDISISKVKSSESKSKGESSGEEGMTISKLANKSEKKRSDSKEGGVKMTGVESKDDVSEGSEGLQISKLRQKRKSSKKRRIKSGDDSGGSVRFRGRKGKKGRSMGKGTRGEAKLQMGRIKRRKKKLRKVLDEMAAEEESGEQSGTLKIKGAKGENGGEVDEELKELLKEYKALKRRGKKRKCKCRNNKRSKKSGEEMSPKQLLKIKLKIKKKIQMADKDDGSTEVIDMAGPSSKSKGMLSSMTSMGSSRGKLRGSGGGHFLNNLLRAKSMAMKAFHRGGHHRGRHRQRHSWHGLHRGVHKGIHHVLHTGLRHGLRHGMRHGMHRMRG